MSTNPTPEQLENRRAARYCLFVNQNPSFKTYVVTTGMYWHDMSFAQLQTLSARIHAPRSSFSIYSYALCRTFAKTFIPQ